MPEDHMPEYTMRGYATPVINAEEDYKRAKAALIKALSDDKVLEGVPPVMGSDDSQMLASPFNDVPILFIEIGAGAPDSYKNLMEKGQLPAIFNHNPRYTVDLEAIPTGTIALTAVVLEYLGDLRDFIDPILFA
jgi:hippurate hydrolase